MFDMDDNVEYDLDTICRTCLNYSDDMKSVFYIDGGNDTIALHELIMACTQVQISKDDGMPYQICNTCTTRVQSAYDYKKICEASDSKLRTYIERKFSEVKIKEETDFICEIKPEITTTDEDPLNELLLKNLKKYSINVDSDDNEIDNDDTKDLDFCIEDHEEEDVEENEVADSAKKIDGRLICHICDKSLADKHSFKLHIRLHTGKNLKKCPTCGRGFSKKSHLERHLQSHLKKEYACEHCNEKFDCHQERRMHMLVHNLGKVGKKRGRPSKELQDLKATFAKEELATLYDAFYCLGSSNDTKICICKICNQTFHKIYKLREHLAWHSNDVQSFCDINLISKLELFDNTKIDINIETNENMISFIQNELKTKYNSRFYQILNSNSWELSLTDSETESDEDTVISEWKLPQREHICSKCNKSFDRLHKIIFHMKHEHEYSDFTHKCHHCKKVYPNNLILEKHLRSQCENTTKNVNCNVCKVKFMWKNSCETHSDKMHLKGPPLKGKQEKNKLKEKTFVCDICSKAFYRGEHLDRHRKIHMPAEKKFSCDMCNKKFNRKDNLKSHMRVHKEDKDKEDSDKHLCVYCGRSFSNSSNLIVHMRRHTGEKPYKCDLCDKGFPRSSDLQCHRRTHTGEKPCLCTICGKGFSRSNKLVRHMRIHTGVRPYKCTYCDRAFTQSNDLTLHIRRHTGDKPYVCGICGDRFIQGTALQTHRRMQGHYEEVNQPTPFSSISVNNPNRFTNVNRVNRIGISPTEQMIKQETKLSMAMPMQMIKQETKPLLTMPLSLLVQPQIQSQQSSSQPVDNTSENNQTTMSVNATATSTSTTTTRTIPNFGILPPPYLPNANPFLMQNLEVPTMFTIPHFNQGFN